MVVDVVAKPAIEKVPRTPDAPAHLQHQREIAAIDRPEDEQPGQHREPQQERPERPGVLVLDRFAEVAVPVVVLDAQKHEREGESNDRRQQNTGAPAFLRAPVRRSQRPGSFRKPNRSANPPEHFGTTLHRFVVTPPKRSPPFHRSSGQKPPPPLLRAPRGPKNRRILRRGGFPLAPRERRILRRSIRALRGLRMTRAL